MKNTDCFRHYPIAPGNLCFANGKVCDLKKMNLVTTAVPRHNPARLFTLRAYYVRSSSDWSWGGH